MTIIPYVYFLIILVGVNMMYIAIDVQEVCDMECNYYSESINMFLLLLGTFICFIPVVLQVWFDRIDDAKAKCLLDEIERIKRLQDDELN